MDNWEKLKIISTSVSAVVIPLVLFFVGNNYTAATKERELQGKFVELAVAILREAPLEETRNLRDWAIEVINNYSGVPLSEQAQKDLREKTPLLAPGSAGISVPEVQQMLKELGYFSGPIDGVSGDALVKALVNFQKDHALIPDGLVGARTVRLLTELFEKAKSDREKGSGP